jgi:hypothetical protein
VQEKSVTNRSNALGFVIRHTAVAAGQEEQLVAGENLVEKETLFVGIAHSCPARVPNQAVAAAPKSQKVTNPKK